MGLSNISTRIVVKDKNKCINRYCLKKVLKKYGKTDIKDPNKNGYNVKKSAITQSQNFIHIFRKRL